MAIQVIELGKVSVSGWERIEFSVELPDLEQVVIMANQGGYYFDNVTNSWQTKKDLKKFRLTTFDYQLDEGVMSLVGIRGNFFTKANRVGARTAWLRQLDKATLDQIPSKLFDYGYQHFAKELTPFLQRIIDTGLVVIPNA